MTAGETANYKPEVEKKKGKRFRANPILPGKNISGAVWAYYELLFHPTRLFLIRRKNHKHDSLHRFGKPRISSLKRAELPHLGHDTLKDIFENFKNN